VLRATHWLKASAATRAVLICLPSLRPAPLDVPAEFTNCTVPLVWFLSYFNVFGELFLNAGAALDAMKAAEALDRCGLAGCLTIARNSGSLAEGWVWC